MNQRGGGGDVTAQVSYVVLLFICQSCTFTTLKWKREEVIIIK